MSSGTSGATALTIAGSDPSGGAGVQADLRTFQDRGVYGISVLTLLTVQNAKEVKNVQVLDADFVRSQFDAVLEVHAPNAMKTGALGSRDIVELMACLAGTCPVPLVVDPVILATSGARLLSEEAVQALAQKLLPRAALVTPNLKEAGVLSGRSVRTRSEFLDAAKAISDFGPQAVLIKGGHLDGAEEAVDMLFEKGYAHFFSAPRFQKSSFHGTGCTLSAAITAELAKGVNIFHAVEKAKEYLHHFLETR